MSNGKIDLSNAYYHGVCGNEVSFVSAPKTAFHIMFYKIGNIIKHKNIYSREKTIELGVSRPEFGYHMNFADTSVENHYVSVCKRIDGHETAFSVFIKDRISFALHLDENEFIFRDHIEYWPDPGEEQVLDNIDISNVIAIVVDLEEEGHNEIAIEYLEKMLIENKISIPIVDIEGNILREAIVFTNQEENFIENKKNSK